MDHFEGTDAGRPGVGAIATGLFIGLLGYLAALAQGMGTAPSGWGGMLAILLMLAGGCLAILGFASIWLTQLKPAARLATRSAIILLVAGFLLDKALALSGF